MILRRDFFKTDSALPALVCCFSILNLYNHLNAPYTLSAFWSIIGLAGVFLFAIQNKHYHQLIYIWLLGQLIIISHEAHYAGSENWYNEPVLDLSQGFNFVFSFSLAFSSDKYSIGVNVLPIIGFGLLKVLQLSPLIGQSITFYQFREDNLLGDIFPIEGEIIKRITLSGEKDWLLVQLIHPFQFQDSIVSEVIIKRKDGEIIQIKSGYQLVWFRLVLNSADVMDKDNLKEKFPFIDWALCQ